MRIYRLIHMATRLVQRLAEADPVALSASEVRHHLDQGTIFEFLEERLDFMSAFEPVHELELSVDWADMAAANSPHEVGCQRDGTCYLLWIILENIQRRIHDPDMRMSEEYATRCFEPGWKPPQRRPS